LLALILSACGPRPGGEPAASDDQPVSSDDTLPTPTTLPDSDNVIVNEATVESIEILLLESFPVQVNVHVKGYLGDGCTTLGSIIQEREGDTFNVTIQTNRPADKVCTQMLVAFEETIPLAVQGLEAGTYTVNVNGVTDTFTLAVDNVLPETEADETPVGQSSLAPADLAEIIKLTLERALVDQEIPDFQLLEDKENIVLSAENIDPSLAPTLPGINLILLTPEEIQARADEEGDFLYLSFQPIESESESKATVSLNNTWARATDSETMYLSGGGFTVEYTKESGNWTGEVTTAWIS
jgi:hypothetical protein